MLGEVGIVKVTVTSDTGGSDVICISKSKDVNDL